MHDHLEESHSRNANVSEIMCIFLPWSFIIDLFLLNVVVAIESVALRVNNFDGVLKLCFG